MLRIHKLDLRPDDFGFGFLWAWIYCTWFTPGVFSGSTAGENFAVYSDASWLISLGSCSLSLFCFLIFLEKRRRRAGAVMATTSFLVFVGTLGLHLTYGRTELASLHVLSAIATGIASAGMWTCWGMRYETKTKRLTLLVPLSSLVVIGCLLINFALTDGGSLLLCLLLPLVSGALFLLPKGNDTVDEGRAPSKIDKGKAREVLIRLCAAALCACAASAFAQATALEAVAPQLLPLGVLFGLILVCVTSIPPLFIKQPFNFVKPARLLLCLEAVTLALLIINVPAAKEVAYCLSVAVSTCFDFLLFLYLIALIEKGLLSSTLAFCLSEGFVQIGWLLGNGLGILSLSVDAFNIIEKQDAYLLLICLLFVLLIVVVDQQDNVEKMVSFDSDKKDVAAIAHKYGLTKRETEILILLGQGRSVPFISDSLFLAKSTIGTHVKHIYGKLGVHSKQELIDLIENVR